MSTFINGHMSYDKYINSKCIKEEHKRYMAKLAIVNQFLAKKENGEALTFADELQLVSCIKVSCLTGKLDKFYCITTNVMMNPICQERAKIPGSICESCYATRQYVEQMLCLEINYMILNNFLISKEAWATLAIPSTNGKARIESHGDTATVICARNYCRIVESHYWLIFGVFSKNINHYRVAFAKETKPTNMIFILSSVYINVAEDVPDDMMEYVDHVFTVYTKEYAREHDININCGEYDADFNIINHKCASCLNCYIFGTEFNINELLKNKSGRVV